MKKFLLKIKAQEYLPLFMFFLAMIMLGIILFRHISLSQQPPMGDAFSYWIKAKNFWSSVGQNKWFNPLNIEPTFRPPGTVLMSYPLGFLENPHGFYFRSIFLPITLFVAALWIIAKPYCSTLKDQWLLAAFCLAFATLPLFYHFERNNLLSNSPTYWGLVDNFFAAVAALGTALVIRGVYSFSIFLTFLGIITSAFCLFIKPAGGIIMVAIFLVWVVYVWTVHLSVPRVWQRNRRFRRYLLFSTANYTFIYGATALSSLNSQYFSPDNRVYGKRAIEVLKQDFSITEWWPLLKTQIHVSFGWHWLVLIVLTCAFSFYRTRKQLPLDLLSALSVILLGLWFWLVATEQGQIRYFFPFALMSLTLCFPRVFSFYTNISKCKFRILTGFLLSSFILLLFLLFPSSSPISLQRIVGMNLSSGSLTNEVQQAKSLVDLARKEGQDLNLYSFAIDGVEAVFLSIGMYDKTLHPNLPSFTFKIPVDWIRTTTFRFDEIASSDYLLFSPILDSAQVANILKKGDVRDFNAESQLFHAWLSAANEDSGLEIKSETSLRLLKIIDKSKFVNALEKLRSKYTWREIFLDANPVKWVDRATADRLSAKSDKAFRGIHFGNEFALLGAITKRTNDGLRIELVWESLKEQSLMYKNFVHLVDAEGNILSQVDYEQDLAKRLVHKGRLWHDVVHITNEKLVGAKAIGLGIYMPSAKVLTVDGGSNDWDSKRLLININ